MVSGEIRDSEDRNKKVEGSTLKVMSQFGEKRHSRQESDVRARAGSKVSSIYSW